MLVSTAHEVAPPKNNPPHTPGSVGVDEKTYGTIHVDFPARFVAEWTNVSDKSDISFHYISSSDISEDSSAMWARQKVRAERTPFEFAKGTNLRVIAYRPDYIGPTEEEAHIGQDLLFWFFAPVGAAVRCLELQGKYLKMFTNKIEHVPTIEDASTEELIELLRDVIQTGNLDIKRLLTEAETDPTKVSGHTSFVETA